MAEKDIYKLYKFVMQICGFEKSISKFVNDLDLELKDNNKILEVGCGTGVIGLQLIEKFPKSTLFATDILEKFLYQTIHNAEKRGISKDKISVAISDISTPDKVTLLDNSSNYLEKESFDIVCVGATIGYSKNKEETIKKLLDLIKPKGYLINLEMNEWIIGKLTSDEYQYSNIPLTEMKKIIEEMGHEVSFIPLSMKYFPTNLTRIGMVVRKNP